MSFTILENDQSVYISNHVGLVAYYNPTDAESLTELKKFLAISETELNAREKIFRKVGLYVLNKTISYNDAFSNLELAVREAELLPDSDILNGLVCQVFAGFLFENRADEQAIEFLKKTIRLLKPDSSEQEKYNLNSKLCFA